MNTQREWKEHTYIDKIPVGNGKFRYIYEGMQNTANNAYRRASDYGSRFKQNTTPKLQRAVGAVKNNVNNYINKNITGNYYMDKVKNNPMYNQYQQAMRQNIQNAKRVTMSPQYGQISSDINKANNALIPKIKQKGQELNKKLLSNSDKAKNFLSNLFSKNSNKNTSNTNTTPHFTFDPASGQTVYIDANGKKHKR